MKIILSGFKTKKQARQFLEWFEGQGEQDEGISMYMEGAQVSCNVQKGMIEHEDGFEYELKIHEF